MSEEDWADLMAIELLKRNAHSQTNFSNVESQTLEIWVRPFLLDLAITFRAMREARKIEWPDPKEIFDASEKFITETPLESHKDSFCMGVDWLKTYLQVTR